MRGYPKNLNTKEDYEYVRKNFPRSMWEQDFKNLLLTEAWFCNGEIADEGVEDDTHKIVKDEENNKSYQYELRDNPTAKIYRIGYTKEEVEAILGENADE